MIATQILIIKRVRIDQFRFYILEVMKKNIGFLFSTVLFLCAGATICLAQTAANHPYPPQYGKYKIYIICHFTATPYIHCIAPGKNVRPATKSMD